jgi:hypothetical protein
MAAPVASDAAGWVAQGRAMGLTGAELGAYVAAKEAAAAK